MKQILNIFIREVLRLRSRSSAWILIIFIPVVIFLYLGAIYEEGAVQVVQVGILDNDKSPFSQQIIDNIQASPKIEVVNLFSSEDKLEDIFISHPDIKGVYYIPENFSKNIMLGMQQKLIVYTNSSNIIYGNLLYKEAATFINTLSAKINLECAYDKRNSL